MTFVQENKEKNIRIEKMGIKDISAVVRMCDQCVGEKLYSESEIRDAAANPDSFIFLLKNQENMLCGYVYFQKTSQNEMADFLKIDQAVLKNLMGSEKNTLVNFRSIGIEPKMRNKGLSEILFSFTIEYSQKILKADYMLGAFWKKYDEIPMESNLRKFKFEHLLTVKNMWYENEKLICPVCKGRCTCSAEIYIKELKEEMQ